MFGQSLSPGADYSRPMSAYGGSNAGMAYPMQMNVSAARMLSAIYYSTFISIESQHDVGYGQPICRPGHDGCQHGLSEFNVHGHVCRRIAIRRRRRCRSTSDFTGDASTNDATTDDVSGFTIHDATDGLSGNVSVGDAAASANDDAAPDVACDSEHGWKGEG